MMTIGLDCVGGSDYGLFDCRASMQSFDYLEIRNGIFDEWKIDSELILFTPEQKHWDYDTMLLATFNNTLEAGNVSNEGREIEYLRFKRRSKNRLKWTTFAQLSYSTHQTHYSVFDRLVQGQEEYEYCVVPVSQGIEGRETIQDVVCDFDGLWLVDNEMGYKLMYDLNYGSISYTQQTAVLETLEYQYPFFMTNSINYKRGSITAKIVTTKSADDMIVDFYSERQLRERMFEFVSNRKPKILKDFLGRYYLVMLSGVRETPDSRFGGGLVDVSFDWMEIGDANNTKDLEDMGLLQYDLNQDR